MALSKYRDMVVAKELSYVNVTGGYDKGDDEFIRYYNKIAGTAFNVDTTPWCAIFQTYNLRMCNIPTWVCPNFAGCGTIDDGFLKPAGFHKGYKDYIPLPGDLVIFDWNGGHCSRDHVGMVERVDGNTLYTIEGNSTGGYKVAGVRHKSYDLGSKFIALYGALPYESIDTMTNPYPVPQKDVKNGSSGSDARYVQWHLNLKEGMSSVIIDGAFGPKTEAAVKAFQQKYNLNDSGICDSATIAMMVGGCKKEETKKAETKIVVPEKKVEVPQKQVVKPTIVAPKAPVVVSTPKPVVAANELSDAVQKSTIKKFQRWLKSNFKLTIKVDGTWDKESHKAAIAAFQILCNKYCKKLSTNKLVVDGIWGPATRQAAGYAESLVKSNMSSQFVILLKYMLYVNDYNPKNAHSLCNKTTVETITRYQKNHNFAKVQCDGECGQITWTELFTRTKC